MERLFTARTVASWLVCSGAATGTIAAQDTIPHRLAPMVTVTRDVGRSLLDLPYAISSIEPDSIRPGSPHTQIEELLFLLPGITVASRTNPSQDARISVRGFGARSAFGVRSIRVLRDGMPLTLPDGQTPIDYLDLESVAHIEAIRGTASALYGNASGGVINLRSGPAPAVPLAVQLRSWGGSYGLQRYAGVFGGTLGQASYQGNVGHTRSDNYRAFSHQRLTNGYGHLAFVARGTDYTVQALGLDMPVAENPGALTAAQVDSNPRMADPIAVKKLARKQVQQLQVGVSARRRVGRASRGELSAQVYGGTRALYTPLTYAIVDVARHQYGGSIRATLPFDAFNLENRVSAGIDVQRQDDGRRNFANCNGLANPSAACPIPGREEGVLQLDQREIVSSVGPYVRDELGLGRRVILSAGVRSDAVRFEVRDRMPRDPVDASGNRTLHAVSPTFGLLVRLSRLRSLYANVSSAFETPTTTELGNQVDGTGGLNRTLEPQFATTYEAGVKGFVLAASQFELAGFDTEVRDELIPYQVAGANGRTYFRNAGSTRRMGVEVGSSADVGPFGVAAAYTFSRFRFRDFRVDTSQYTGRAIPGIPEHQVEGSATLRHGVIFWTVEGILKGHVFVNDANTARSPGYGIVNLTFGATAFLGRPWLSPVFRMQNVFDRRYAGSVVVNASGPTVAATKFYEPAPGRTLLVGLTLASKR